MNDKLHRVKVVGDVYKGNLSSVKINGLKIFLNKYTLVPHKDTMRLIELARNIIARNSNIKSVADVGTGSGIIALSLAKEFPDKKFYASDICRESLIIAKRNARINKIENIEFLLNKDNLWMSEFGKIKIDFIVSNPPFVGEEEYESEEFRTNFPEIIYEPINAIVTRNDKGGLNPYLKIINNAKKNNCLNYLFQCNCLNIYKLSEEIKKTNKYKTLIYKDNDSKKRFLFVTSEL